jgi:hypothetical protein
MLTSLLCFVFTYMSLCYREQSIAGIVLSYWVYIVYMIATAFEE